MGFQEPGQWNEEPFDPTEAESTDEAVFIGQQTTGETLVIGREEKEEWLKTSDMGPLPVEEYR
jgi:hypothetical protein